MGQVFLANVVHVLLAEDYKPVEALLADGLDEALDEGVRIGSAERPHLVADAESLERRDEPLRELPIPVVLHVPDRQATVASLLHERFGLACVLQRPEPHASPAQLKHLAAAYRRAGAP